MAHLEHFQVLTEWTGNLGTGTSKVGGYSRNHTCITADKPALLLSTGNKMVGDASRLNPEDLLVSAVSSCHLLTYLYLCATEGIVITAYRDEAEGVMEEFNGGGQFREVVLRPRMRLLNPQQKERALQLHVIAHEQCIIARSVNFEVRCEPQCED